jgi:sulfur relay protein TusB/DsrH
MEARIVLLQDAVYHATKGEARGKMYVLEDDVTRRGLKSRIHPSFQAIGYSDLVQMMEEETVVNFL